MVTRCTRHRIYTSERAVLVCLRPYETGHWQILRKSCARRPSVDRIILKAKNVCIYGVGGSFFGVLPTYTVLIPCNYRIFKFDGSLSHGLAKSLPFHWSWLNVLVARTVLIPLPLFCGSSTLKVAVSLPVYRPCVSMLPTHNVLTPLSQLCGSLVLELAVSLPLCSHELGQFSVGGPCPPA